MYIVESEFSVASFEFLQDLEDFCFMADLIKIDNAHNRGVLEDYNGYEVAIWYRKI